MSDREHDLAGTMTSGLDQQVSRLHRPPLDLGSVQRRARSIRRRRRGVAAGAVALLVAIAVPAALSLGPGQDRGQGLPPADDLAPATRTQPYLREGTVVLGDGRTVDTGYRADAVQQLALLDDGRVVLAVSQPDGSGSGIVVVPTDGGAPVEHPVGDTLSLRSSPDRSLVAWIDADDRPEVLESGVDEPVALAALTVGSDTRALVVGVGGSDCATGGCRVWAVTGTAQNEVADAEGVSDVALPAGLTLSDVHAPDGEVELMAASEESLGGDQVPCAVLLGPDGTQRARTCDTAFLRFSPGGTRLQGGSYENDTTGEVTVLDTDLQTLATIAPTATAVSRITWEDDGSLLAVEQAVVGDGVDWTLVRYPATDPSAPEVVAGPVRGEEFPPALRVAD